MVGVCARAGAVGEVRVVDEEEGEDEGSEDDRGEEDLVK